MREYIDGDYRVIEHDGGAVERLLITAPPLPPALQSVTRFQARAALYNAGLLDAAEALMADADPIARLAWSDAQTFQRNSPTIAALAPALGLSDADIDALFAAAALIDA